MQNGFGIEPENSYRDGDEPKEVDHPLHLQSDQFFPPRPIRLRAERIETGGETLKYRKARDVGRHTRQTHCTKLDFA